MSMHFVPQWVKPIKPSGSQPTTPTASTALNGGFSGGGANSDLPSPSIAKSSQPFPALGGIGSGAGAIGARGSLASPTTATGGALSYSRATYQPQSPSVADTSYFPDQDANPGNPYPFRYSRDQILGLYDETKFKDVPIELMELLDQGGILVSKQPVKPVGLRELTEVEKKLLSTSVHPTIPTRNRANPSNAAAGGGGPDPNSNSSRRTNPSNKDPLSNGTRIGRFGQGDASAFGSGKIGTIGAAGQEGVGRTPGAIGGGFGGVSKRMGLRRQESVDERTSTWRPTRTNSGNFEGVLGFGGGGAVGSGGVGGPAAVGAAPAITEDAPIGGGTGEEKKDAFGNGGGPGWGNGQKKWRLAVGGQSEEEKTLTVPNAADHKPVESLAATPSATPVPDRDAGVANIAPPSETPAAAPTPAPAGLANPQPQASQEAKEDLGAIEWFYRDPAGQEQGPFIATQMHEWFSHSYFQDDLPLRRAHESTFHTLGELKTATGSHVQPFLSAVRPRLPPNLPIPSRSASGAGAISPIPQPGMSPSVSNNTGGNNGFPVDAFRGMSLGPGMQAQMNAHTHPFSAGPFSPAPAAGAPFMQSPGFGSPVAPMHPHHQHQLQQQQPFLGHGQHQQQPQQQQPWGPMTPGQIPFGARGNIETPARSPFGPIAGAEPFGAAGMYTPGAQGPFSPAPGGGIPFNAQGNGWYGNANQNQAAIGGFRQMTGQDQQAGGDPFQSTPIEQPQYMQQQQQQPAQETVPEQIQQASPVKQQQQEPTSVQPTPQQEPVQLEPEVQSASEPVVETTPTASSASTNAWVQASKPTPQAPARKASIAAPSPAPAVVTPSVTSPKKPTTSLARPPSPPPASHSVAAPKPAAPIRAPSPPLPKVDKPAPITLSNVIDKAISPSPVATSATAAGPKAAPWATATKDKKDEKEKTGPSLRQIQEAEAKQAEARRAARAAAAVQTQQTSGLTSSSGEDLPTSMAWGLASSGSGKATVNNTALQSPSIAAAPTAVWGAGDAAAPKKTLKQIQEEEEKRKRAVQAKAAATASATLATGPAANGPSALAKRGYADLAAAPAAPIPGWSTVGVGGKPIPGAAPKVAATPTPLVRTASAAATARPASAASTGPRSTNGPSASASLDDTYTPSLDFIKWAKTALTGLRTPVDEFLQICLSFPIDPPGATKADALEIISDTVYANSGMLDGRRFATDFFEKRKADAKKQQQTNAASKASGGWTVSGSASALGSNLADVVKSVQGKKEDTGFKVVKAKGKKK